MPLNFGYVYRVTHQAHLSGGAVVAGPPFVAAGVRLVRVSGHPIPRLDGQMNGIVKDTFSIWGRVVADDRDTVRVEDMAAAVPEERHYFTFEYLTREMLPGMPGILGLEVLLDQLRTTEDVQNYFRVLLVNEDFWFENPDQPLPASA